VSGREDRIFIRDGRKHFRRTYSSTEVKIGAAIVVALALIASWVAWKGAHPDPELFKQSPGLVNRAKIPVDRGPLPEGIAPEGWKEGELSTFGTEDLYVKINGREGYYKSFGFQRLWFVALTREQSSIDIEVYDLGEVGNAIGAFAGEVPESATTEVAGGLIATDRNALFLVRGRYYLRAIGSDETEATRAALQHAAATFTRAVAAEPLPWSFDLFAGLGVAPAKISFQPENAFSFGFAKDVHSGLLPDGETELFVVLSSTEEAAKALAAQFSEGFLQYGRKIGVDGGVSWVQDQYLQRISGAKNLGRIVVGVRGASDVKAASSLIARLAERTKSIPLDAIATEPPPPSASKAPKEEEY
jgi:hypothetical protein